ncbi:helix-turn-helix domain-containing protein (plasmid) [Lichenicola cladoniae]|uniref:Helix-turn-helix domain-containing protein n=1 Tax=Lichenicola cladoniae TaxID=1484109 RepID=A0A6M8I2L0_9PROT|nr:TrfB-related DNA-binding protein [Lichenicola cladoniae]NPD70356.1 helix-turn-helix domain-containing protein [Acetobacteraceae bacterium]QKE94011.1 helix-turn-helix domain-containing protein [Lichenicola cladoniae]
MAKTTMTQDDFDALRPSLGRMTVDTMDVARLVLVAGVSQADAAGRYGMSRQRVYGIMKRFEAASQGWPTDWRKVEVWLPPKLAAEVEGMAEAAIAEHRGSQASPKR